MTRVFGDAFKCRAITALFVKCKGGQPKIKQPTRKDKSKDPICCYVLMNLSLRLFYFLKRNLLGAVLSNGPGK